MVLLWMVASSSLDLPAAVSELLSRRTESVVLPSVGADVQPSLDSSGRWMAFTSSADFLEGDRNGTATDVFLRDLHSGTVTRISHQFGGPASGNGASHSAQITPNAQWVVFASEASDLVADDANNASDVFAWHRESGEIRLVSGTPQGYSGNQASMHPVVSGDGRHVLFTSFASDLVSGDDNEVQDLFRHDLQTGSTACVSVTATLEPAVPAGGFAGRVSQDGRHVIFQSLATNVTEAPPRPAFSLYHRDMEAGTTRRLIPEIPGILTPRLDNVFHELSSDGRSAVVIARTIYSAVDGVTNTLGRLILFNLEDGSSQELGQGIQFLTGCQAFGTRDFRRIVFDGVPPQMTTASRSRPYVWDAGVGTRALPELILTVPPLWVPITNAAVLALRPDGESVLLSATQADLIPDLPRNSVQLVEYNFRTGESRLVSRTDSGNPIAGAAFFDPIYAPDGRSILFGFGPPSPGTIETNAWPGLFLSGPAATTPTRFPDLTAALDRESDTTTQPSNSSGAATSDDGRHVLFVSFAGDLGSPRGADGFQNLYLHDRVTGLSTLITPFIAGSTNHRGVILSPSMTPEASQVVFASNRPDLVASDRNQSFDVFHWTRSTRELRAISTSVSGPGTAANFPSAPPREPGSLRPMIQSDGAAILFESSSRDLVPKEPRNGNRLEVYRHDLRDRTTSMISFRPASAPSPSNPTRYGRMSDDGSVVAFAYNVATASGGAPMIYRPQTRTWTALLPSNPCVDTFVSPSGKLVGFLQRPTGSTSSRNLVVWSTETTNLLINFPLGSAPVRNLHFSSDDKWIAFSTTASLVIADRNNLPDIYLIRMTNGSPILISALSNGRAGNGASDQPMLSPDGARIAFRTRATDLTDDTVTGAGDIFIREVATGRMRPLLESPPTDPVPQPKAHPIFSRDGSSIVFTSAAGLAPRDRNNLHDVYTVAVSPATEQVAPEVELSARPGGGWTLSWVGLPGLRYQAQLSDGMGLEWTALTDPLDGTNAVLRVEEGPSSRTARFYRVAVLR